MPTASSDSADLSAAVESLHRAHVLLRLAGPLAEPDPGRGGGMGWMSWLKSAQAEKEGRLVATSHRLAAKGAYREIPRSQETRCPSLSDPVKASALLQWMLSARHPRPLVRWCESALDSGGAATAPVVVAVAMSAFHFPRHEAISVWFYLRWRAAWQAEIWPCPRDFLVASGRLLPMVRRRLLRHPFGPPAGEGKTQAARL